MKLPLRIPVGFKPIITQPYGDKSSVDWYKANGLDLTEHNGTDFIVGDSIQTYGTPVVCPVPKAELSRIWFTNAMSTSGNGIQICWEDNGGNYSMRCWHLSETVSKMEYSEGDIIGYLGNSGLCRPAPTYSQPFNGSHLHLMLWKNSKLIDPLSYFNKNEWYVGEDTGTEKDLPPLFWALNYAKGLLQALFNKIK